jgi:hypothetical protein
MPLTAMASMFNVDWEPLDNPVPLANTTANEFHDYLMRYGGYIRLYPHSDHEESVKPLFTANRSLMGCVVGRDLFFLPCTVPPTRTEAVEAAKSAVSAVMAYRLRTSEEMPEWVDEFRFDTENALHHRLADLHQQMAEATKSIDLYSQMKGALVYQSEPLVSVIDTLLKHFLDIHLNIDDKYIEDASLIDEDGKIIAVFEIKGVKGSFTRHNVNQVDSHRERMNLSANVPGVLIMNTHMAAKSLIEKDQRPHPDIIKKAVADNVLMIRTLDLLRCADAVDRGVLSKQEFRRALFTESGWLKVEGDTLTIVKE